MVAYRSKLVLIISLIIVLVTLLVLWLWDKNNVPQPQRQVTSFESCVQAGYPVAESDPRQCRTPNGQVFVEKTVSPEDDSDSQTPEPQSDWYVSQKGTKIQVTSPAMDAVVTSPLRVTGQAPGSWSFEATFPVEVLDASRSVIGQGYVTVQSDNWMTEKYLPFEGAVEFTSPASKDGYIVLKKDNASGLPEHDDSVELAVRFE